VDVTESRHDVVEDGGHRDVKIAVGAHVNACRYKERYCSRRSAADGTQTILTRYVNKGGTHVYAACAMLVGNAAASAARCHMLLRVHKRYCRAITLPRVTTNIN